MEGSISPHRLHTRPRRIPGKILIPSEEKLKTIKKRIENLKKKTKNRGHIKFLNSIYVEMDFYEPYRVPPDATNGFFYHLVKEGINVEHMKSLASCTCEALRRASAWLSRRNGRLRSE